METHPYTVLVKGHLDERWFDWFSGLTVTQLPEGQTVIAGGNLDQSALHAILNRVRDLGLELIAVQQMGEAK